MPTLILRLTGSPVATAFAYVVEFVPYIVIGPIAGIVADRFPRRRIMIAADSASVAIAVALALLARIDHPPIAALYALALLLACTRPFYFPALQGLTVDSVPEERRAGFNAWTQVSDGLLSFTGPVFGTAVVAAAGVSTATVIDAATFAASATLVAATARPRTRTKPRPRSEPTPTPTPTHTPPPTHTPSTAPPTAPPIPAVPSDPSPAAAAPPPITPLPVSPQSDSDKSPQPTNLLRDLATGFRAIGYAPAILWGTILITVANLAAFTIEGNLVYLLLHSEGQSKVALGVVFGAQGLGAIVAGTVAPRLMKLTSAGLMLTVGMAMSALAMAIPAIAPHWGAIVAGQAVEGAASALIVVCWFTSLQRIIPAEIIGRFVAVGRAIAYATIPAGALLGALLLNASGSIRALFAAAGAVQILVFAATTRSPVAKIRADDAKATETADSADRDIPITTES